MASIMEILHVFKHAIVITGFVFVMMLVIEYINVQTKGIWQKNLSGNLWKTYFLAAALGALPGCLGAFTAVALFSHRLISFGAIVTTMIATSGDEAFVMFAMMPEKAIWLTVIIVVIGILAGYLTDKFYDASKILNLFSDKELPLHQEEKCDCFQKDKFLQFILKPSLPRLSMAVIIIFLVLGVVTGMFSAEEPFWMRATLVITFLISLFIVMSVPDHFLKEHLWNHIVKVHIPRIFLWTFGTLLLIHFLMDFINVQAWIADNMLWILLLAVLVGIIPESGPHLVFVTLFIEGSIPFSILIASSIVQDGHGMLPLFAESKHGFFAVKGVNIIVGLLVGSLGLLIGY